ncbi:MAG: hypothetical protein RPS47_14045, partial [Colwellia sp.]
IGEQVVATANVGTMGTELHENLGYFDPRFGWDLSSNKPTAGEYQAIGLDLQGTSAEYAARLQAGMEATKAKIESGDETQLADLTKQALVGDMLESTIFSYFAMNNIQDDIAAQQADIVNYRAPSYGKFSTKLNTAYWFGVPRNVKAAGLIMDVDRVFNNKVHKDNDHEKRLNFNQMVGSRYSAMEHLVPEQMFSTPEAPAQGISAVKAIALAGAAGQKIWTITSENLDLALTEVTLPSDTETEIRNSVNAGMIVTAHEKSINFNGWVGEGYIILDPQTGAGAYKIAGGGNGGFLNGDTVDILGFVGFAAGVIGGSLAVTSLIVIAAVIATVLIIELIFDYNAISHRCQDLSALIALSVIMALAGIFVGPLMAVVLMYTGLFASGGAIAVAKSSTCKN